MGASAVALAGWLVKASWLAVAGLTAIEMEVALLRLVLVKIMAMLVATVCERLV